MNPNDVSQDVFDAAFAEFQRAQDDCPPGSIVRATGGWPLRCAIAAAVKAEREAHRALVEALKAIAQYGSDTLSGPVEGPDDREWQRESVVEMTRRARAALDAIRARGDAT